MLNEAHEWNLGRALHVAGLNPDREAEEDHRAHEDRCKDGEPAIGVYV